MKGLLFVRWMVALSMVAVVVGTAAAGFLWGLDWVTRLRFSQSWLVYLLPVAGLGMGYYYRTHGRFVGAGNQVILAELHHDRGKVPALMAPSVVLATLVTHLFGGSAGREGTAVQMGAGMGAWVGGFVSKGGRAKKIFIFCGISAGFGAVFGTPFAGALFALEFTRFRLLSRKLIPCLFTALLADQVCHAWGIGHTVYPAIMWERSLGNWFPLMPKIFVFACVVALLSRFFVWVSKFVAGKLQVWFPDGALRAAVGGMVVILLFWLAGTGDYLGLGVLAEDENAYTLPRFFAVDLQAPAETWMWKIAFTVVTLGAGFKGGEVTPLFFIGAALGNWLAWVLDAPVDLFAGMGMIAFFAAATKTPWASLVMGIELLGWGAYAPLAMGTFLAYKLSGKRSVYPEPSEV